VTNEEIARRLQEHLARTAVAHGLMDDSLMVTARGLSPGEAIGNPEHDDYPLVTGRERIMEANVRGACGQAFTDMYGRWEGRIQDVCAAKPTNNYRRAILVATLNAVMRYSGDLNDTLHCRDEGPIRCAGEMGRFVDRERLRPPFALIGYQPRIAEALAALGEVRIVDMDVLNVGRMAAGVRIAGPEQTDQALRDAGCALVTGSTIVNGTIVRFLDLDMPTVFFGVTIAGPARVLGLRRFCPAGR